jgi:WD40 repeat protein
VSYLIGVASRRTPTASEDRTARIWDAATGNEIAVLRGHEGSVTSAAFSPDGSRIVTASGDRTARVWDAATGKEIAVLRGHEDAVRSAAFSPDGSRSNGKEHDLSLVR